MKPYAWIYTLTAALTLAVAGCDPDDGGDDGQDSGATSSPTSTGDGTSDGTGDGTADGSGDGSAACMGENPAGCGQNGCPEGEVCSFETEQCAASQCECEEASGSWACTNDCNGGVCVPEGSDEVCPGPNPADECPKDPKACVPSGCDCDPVAMAWNCTPDCNGGMDC